MTFRLSIADRRGLANVGIACNLLQNESGHVCPGQARPRALAHVAHTNAAAVARVYQRLDGIPLAIELAAARVPVLRVEQITAA